MSQPRLSRVDRIGLRILEGSKLTLRNRTNNTTYILPPETAERWRKYLMAFQQRGKKGSSVRLTGMFRAKNKKDLCTGRVDGAVLSELIECIKRAKQEKDPSLVFFLWRNRNEEGPAFSLSVDVSKPFEKKAPTRRVEADDSFDLPDADDLFGDD